MGVVLKLGGLGVDELMSINTTKGDFCKEHRPPPPKKNKTLQNWGMSCNVPSSTQVLSQKPPRDKLTQRSDLGAWLGWFSRSARLECWGGKESRWHGGFEMVPK